MADAGGVCIPDFELSKVIPGPGGVKLLVAVQGELTCSAKLDVSPCVRVAAERPASPFSRPWSGRELIIGFALACLAVRIYFFIRIK